MISQIIFVVILTVAIYFFCKSIKRIIHTIKLGKKAEFHDSTIRRLLTVLKVAIFQSKVAFRPIAAFFHTIIYLGFFIINIEIIEIIIDGIFGTHRIFSFLGRTYYFFITIFEFFAFGVIIACLIFLIRRNILRLKRFWSKEMTTWPRLDANIILITEILLMCSILIMNSVYGILQKFPESNYAQVGSFPISSIIQFLFADLSFQTLLFIEKFCWWFHIISLLAFLNYIPFSKHLHIFLSFPNVYYSKLTSLGELSHMPQVTQEVKQMLNLETEVNEKGSSELITFGAKNVKDLTWKNLMDAFSCTECGRCVSVCPANLTGKKLSPRKIMMDVRDHLERIGADIRKKKTILDNNRTLFDYISAEEIWACTTCNACTLECPVNIDPISIIIEMRRYLVLELGQAPPQLNAMFSYIENNGAPWQYSKEDRLKWTEVVINTKEHNF